MSFRLQILAVIMLLSGGSITWKEANRVDTRIPPPRLHLQQCTNGKSIYPGKMNKQTNRWAWQPDECNMYHFSPTEVYNCVANNSIVAVGDSLIGNIIWSIHRYGNVPTAVDLEWEANSEELSLTERLTYKKNTSHHKKRLPSEGRFFAVSKSAPVSSMWWAPTQNPRPYDDMRTHRIFKKHLKKADMVLYGGGIWDLGRASCGVHRYFESLTSNLKQIRSEMRPSSILQYMAFHWIHLTDKNKHCNHPDRLSSYREAGMLAASCAGVSYLSSAPMNKFEPGSSKDGVHFSQQISTSELDMALGSLCGTMTFFPPDIECSTETIRRYKALWDSRPANKEDCCVKNTVCGCPLDVEGVDIY
eukprot:TRINITY_DN3350_c0_g2_i1.p1 TRINITY_DN3350_c0_g2~~TRINITY_DN3350_c0_g2_i1.p1  ORF type:complete len:377 (+),score=39.53 TRINITY_DN3350_c0_g2_i1:54-1133(+)